MLALTLNVSTKKAWLGKRLTVAVDATLLPTAETKEIQLSHFFSLFLTDLHGCFDEPLGTDAGSSATKIVNLRGREYYLSGQENLTPPDQQISKDSNLARGEEELFFCSGMINKPEPLPTDSAILTASKSPSLHEIDLDDDEAEAEIEEVPFFIRINSRFDSYSCKNEIIHSVNSRCSRALKPIMPLLTARTAMKIAPVKLTEVRVGFESYRSEAVGGLFGKVATPASKLHLEATPDKISIHLEREDTAKNDLLPFSGEGVLKKLTIALTEANLYKNLIQDIFDNLNKK